MRIAKSTPHNQHGVSLSLHLLCFVCFNQKNKQKDKKSSCVPELVFDAVDSNKTVKNCEYRLTLLPKVCIHNLFIHKYVVLCATTVRMWVVGNVSAFYLLLLQSA